MEKRNKESDRLMALSKSCLEVLEDIRDNHRRIRTVVIRSLVDMGLDDRKAQALYRVADAFDEDSMKKSRKRVLDRANDLARGAE